MTSANSIPSQGTHSPAVIPCLYFMPTRHLKLDKAEAKCPTFLLTSILNVTAIPPSLILGKTPIVLPSRSCLSTSHQLLQFQIHFTCLDSNHCSPKRLLRPFYADHYLLLNSTFHSTPVPQCLHPQTRHTCRVDKYSSQETCITHCSKP